MGGSLRHSPDLLPLAVPVLEQATVAQIAAMYPSDGAPTVEGFRYATKAWLHLMIYSLNSYAQDFSCIDKKHGRLSKMTLENELIKYEDEKGNPADYKVSDNSEKMLMLVEISPRVESLSYTPLVSLVYW